MIPSLEFCDVWKQYGTRSVILRGLSFAIAAGEIALLVGENGAGKTTAFDIACGNQRADHGAIRVHGHCINGHSPQALAGLGVRRMYQYPTVFRSLSIRDNVLLGVQPTLYARFRPWPLDTKRRRLWEEVRDLALPLFRECRFLDCWQTLAAELSFGQQRIVEFLRVIAANRSARVLLLDEPFAGIHLNLADVMWAMIRERSSAGVAALIVEHENDESRYAGLRRLRLIDGRLQ
jgi:ABC-type branched-subunit amino acid transport system ATPase component